MFWRALPEATTGPNIRLPRFSELRALHYPNPSTVKAERPALMVRPVETRTPGRAARLLIVSKDQGVGSRDYFLSVRMYFTTSAMSLSLSLPL